MHASLPTLSPTPNSFSPHTPNTPNTQIYYSLDNGAFVAQLSAMTRMMVALGTVSPEGAAAASSTLHYAHLDESVLPWFDRPPITGSAGAAGGHAPALAPGQAFLLLPSMVAVQTVVSLGGNVALENRFKETKPKAGEAGAAGLSGATAFIVGTGDASGAALNMTEGGTCIKYIDTIGGLWPTPQRGHWFPDDGDIVNFRSKIRQWCFAGKASSPPSGNGAGRKYKLVIYQRDLSRKLANELRALEMLGAALPASQWEIRVLMHTKDRSPCSLAHALRDTDVLLTPHGFQSMLLLFLPRPALLFEVFPYRYYKRGYGPLSREYGVLHAGVMSPPLTWHTRLVLSLISTTYCMIGKQCRNYARSDNVWLTQHGVNVLVAAIYGKLLPALAAAGPRRDKLIE